VEDIDHNSEQLKLKSGASYCVRWDRRVKVRVIDCNGDPVANCAYLLTVGDKTIEGETDSDGWIRVGTQPGEDVHLELADGRVIRILEKDEEKKFQQSLESLSETEEDDADVDNEGDFPLKESEDDDDLDELPEVDEPPDDGDQFLADSDDLDDDGDEDYEELDYLEEEIEDFDDLDENEDEESAD
jgi:hypothetical protein